MKKYIKTAAEIEAECMGVRITAETPKFSTYILSDMVAADLAGRLALCGLWFQCEPANETEMDTRIKFTVAATAGHILISLHNAACNEWYAKLVPSGQVS